METSPRLFALNGVSVGPHLLQASTLEEIANNLRRRNDVLPSSHHKLFHTVSHGFPKDFLPLVWGFRLPTELVDDLRCLTQVVHPLLSFDPVRIEAVDTSGSVEIQGVDGLIPLKGAQGSLSKKMRYSSYEIHLRIFNI